MNAKISIPLANRGNTGVEKISDGARIVSTSSIRRFGVNTFLIDRVKMSKKPVENMKEIKPIKTRDPPTIKDEFI